MLPLLFDRIIRPLGDSPSLRGAVYRLLGLRGAAAGDARRRGLWDMTMGEKDRKLEDVTPDRLRACRGELALLLTEEEEFDLDRGRWIEDVLRAVGTLDF